MKHLYLSFSFLLFSAVCFAQNLVPNPSFEEYTLCPDNDFQIGRCEGWDTFRGSPDYYNNCSSTMGFNNNSHGSQSANSGRGYCGIITYYRGTQYREHLATQLLANLQVGVKYFLSFYVSRADYPSYSIASNKIGAALSTMPYAYAVNESPINNISMVYTDDIINDSLSWVKISGSFVSDSDYQYMMIGNFFEDNNTDTVIWNYTSSTMAYYFIDDVCLSTDSNYCSNWTSVYSSIPDNKFSIFPQPADEFLQIEKEYFQINSFQLFSNTGERIEITYQISSDAIIIDTKQLSNGFYFLKIQFTNETVTKKIIINH